MKTGTAIFLITLVSGLSLAISPVDAQAGRPASASDAERYANASPSSLDMDDDIEQYDDEQTYDFSIRKIGPDGILFGAVFRLYRSLDDASHDRRPIYFTLDEEELLYTACPDSGCPSSPTPSADITAGMAFIEGLGAGTYYLAEIAAPGGYQKLHYPYYIEIRTDGKVFYNEVMSGQPMVEAGGGEVIIINNATVIMPGTGGRGEYLFYIAGAACIIAALFMALKRQRR